jgi:uroporphyrinogen decarboxylase
MKPTNDTFLRALKREQTDYTPLWLMRQAGRYLPEYNATRERLGSFLALAQSPEGACEVTLQPVDRFGLDAAILFSDILTVPDAMGLGLSFVKGEGPVFARPVRTEADVKALYVPDPAEKLKYVTDAVSLIRKTLNNRVPLIGFSGSPFTLACYMIEGGSSKDFATVKQMLYRRPDLLHAVLDVNAKAVTAYLNAQIEAGARTDAGNERNVAGQNAEFTFLTGKRHKRRFAGEDTFFCADDVNKKRCHKLLRLIGFEITLKSEPNEPIRFRF